VPQLPAPSAGEGPHVLATAPPAGGQDDGPPADLERPGPSSSPTAREATGLFNSNYEHGSNTMQVMHRKLKKFFICF